MSDIRFADLTSDAAGLIVAVVQDASTQSVLMVGYQDEEAWSQTVTTGFVHFHSRSRDALWMKGETSGNTLAVQSIAVDCDSDAILITAYPKGPTCHTGEQSCFVPSPSVERTLGTVIDELVATITDRVSASPDTSYTAQLLADGDLAARKVLEEAGELAFAAKDTVAGAPDQRVVEEAADVLYHLFALTAEQGVTPDRVAHELLSRRSDT